MTKRLLPAAKSTTKTTSARGRTTRGETRALPAKRPRRSSTTRATGAEPSQAPDFKATFPASPTGPRIVLTVYGGDDPAAYSADGAPLLFALVYAPERPAPESIAQLLETHLARTLDDAGHEALATLAWNLSRAPGTILATGGPVPPGLGVEGEVVLFAQLYKGTR